jgi:uncharacterized protein with PIN domain
MIPRIIALINRIKGVKQDMTDNQNMDEPLYGNFTKPRCPRCNGPMIEVNAHTHKMACANSMCRR